MKKLFVWLRETFLPCSHARVSYTCRDEKVDYQRCLGCGLRIQSKIQFGNRRPPWGPAADLKKPSQAAVDNYLKTLEIGPAAGRKR